MATMTKSQARAEIKRLSDDPNFRRDLHGDPGSTAGKEARAKWDQAHRSLASAASDPVNSSDAARAAIAEKKADTTFTKKLFEGDGETARTWQNLHKQAAGE